MLSLGLKAFGLTIPASVKTSKLLLQVKVFKAFGLTIPFQLRYRHRSWCLCDWNTPEA